MEGGEGEKYDERKEKIFFLFIQFTFQQRKSLMEVFLLMVSMPNTLIHVCAVAKKVILK